MIDVEKSDGVWTVTINRPAKANALTREMLGDLAAAAEAASAAESPARGLILTGAGAAFSAGMDLAAAESGLASDPLWERLSGAIAAAACPSVAALNGPAAGGAIGMALACDFRVAVPEASLFYPVMRRGLLPQPSDPARLTALIGPSRTKALLLAGRKIDAETALAWGLVDEIAPSGDLIAAARGLLADSLAADPAHAAAIKRMCGP